MSEIKSHEEILALLKSIKYTSVKKEEPNHTLRGFSVLETDLTEIEDEGDK